MRVPTATEFFFPRAPIDAETWRARERAFFHSIRLPNGTYKTTYSHRLDTVNEIVNSVLPPDRPLEIMDVAVSSGVGTVEWMDALDRKGIEYRMTAGDACVRAFLLSFGRFLHVLVHKTGYPLQFDILGEAIPFPLGRRRAVRFPPLFLFIQAWRWMLPILFSALFGRWAVDAGGESMRRLGIGCRRIRLASPRLRERPSLDVAEDDLLVPGAFASRFDVVRAANVLNRQYFSDATLVTMIASLRARLRRNGMLVVCRTDDDHINHGTVFRLTDTGRFEVVCRIGGGSEIEDLALSLPGRAVSESGRAQAQAVAGVGDRVENALT